MKTVDPGAGGVRGGCCILTLSGRSHGGDGGSFLGITPLRTQIKEKPNWGFFSLTASRDPVTRLIIWSFCFKSLIGGPLDIQQTEDTGDRLFA